MTTPEQLLKETLDDLIWDLDLTPEQNLQEYSSEQVTRLNTPIQGLNRLVLYYPVTLEYRHRVEYVTMTPITPLQVLESIITFYDQPISQENLEAISYITGEEFNPDFEHIDSTILALQSYDTLVNGLRPLDDGYLVILLENLGS